MARPSKNSKGQIKDPKTGKYRTGRPLKIKVGSEKQAVDEQGTQMAIKEIIIGKDIISKLETAYGVRASDKQACIHAGISQATLYRFLKQNPEFRERFDTLKEMVPLQAKTNIARDIMAGDTKVAQWLLERVDPDYSVKLKSDSTTTIKKDTVYDDIDLSKLTDEQLSALDSMLDQAKIQPGESQTENDVSE